MKLTIQRVPNRGQIQEIRAVLKSHESKLRGLREAVVNAPRVAYDHALEEMARLDMPHSEKRHFAKRKADAQVKDVRNAAQAEAKELKRELKTASELLELGKGAFSDRFAVLDAATLGDPRRATYMATLAGAGPVALKHAAEQAAATNNAALAAAVISILDSKPNAERPFGRQAVMNIFPEGHDVFEPMNEYHETDRILRDSLSLLGEVMKGAANPAAMVERGLRAQDAPVAEMEGEGDE